MLSQNLLLKVLCLPEAIPKILKENGRELPNNMALFLFNLIFTQRILSGRLGCLTLLNWLECLSGSTNLTLLMHSKWRNNFRAVHCLFFLFSFVSRNCSAWPLTSFILLSVTTSLWCYQSFIVLPCVCSLKTLENPVFRKCLHLSNFHLNITEMYVVKH